MSRKGKGWSLFPELHTEVADLLEEDDLYLNFNHADRESGHTKDYDSNVMGRFDCDKSGLRQVRVVQQENRRMDTNVHRLKIKCPSLSSTLQIMQLA